MKLIRELERRLEGLIDGVAGRVFRGPLHPAELAAALVRRLDLEIDESMVAPNRIDIRVSSSDVEGSVPPELPPAIEGFLEQAAQERGWRLNGPATVSVVIDPQLGRGKVETATSVIPGPRPAWATLSGDTTIPITVNRAQVGRDPSCDVFIPDDRVSRHHAMLRSEAGSVFVVDLGSSNGTRVDGRPVRDVEGRVEPGSVITFGPVTFRFHQH